MDVNMSNKRTFVKVRKHFHGRSQVKRDLWKEGWGRRMMLHRMGIMMTDAWQIENHSWRLEARRRCPAVLLQAVRYVSSPMLQLVVSCYHFQLTADTDSRTLSAGWSITFSGGIRCMSLRCKIAGQCGWFKRVDATENAKVSLSQWTCTERRSVG